MSAHERRTPLVRREPASPSGPLLPPTAHLRNLFEETARPFRVERTQPLAPVGLLPPCPLSLREAGLNLDFLCDLLLRHLLLTPAVRGLDLIDKLKLPWPAVAPGVKTLARAGCVEVTGGDLLQEAAVRVSLTGTGRDHAVRALSRCAYVGPAPVPLDAYVRQCRAQRGNLRITADQLRAALTELEITPEVFDALGAALASGTALLLEGDAGNGKTTMAKRLADAVHRCGPPICVPYALLADGQVVTVYDPALHQPLSDDHPEPPLPRFPNESSSESWKAWPDLRWRLVRRPRLITGPETPAQRFALRQASSGLLEAPLHVRANGGIWIADDLDRETPERLRRLKLILDEGLDFVEFPSGKPLPLPVECLVVGTANFRRAPAFRDSLPSLLHRTIRLEPPTAAQFAAVLERQCRQAGVDFNPNAVAALFREIRAPQGRFNFADPRIFLETLVGICRFREREPVLSDELWLLAARRSLGMADRSAA